MSLLTWSISKMLHSGGNMKLYSKVTSERASKGQGGNDYVDITVNDENGALICSLLVTTNGLINLGTFKEYSGEKHFEHLFKVAQSTKVSKHELIIKSLSDAMADCVCGWHYVFTGEKTREQIEAEYKKHLKGEKQKSEYPTCKKCGYENYRYACDCSVLDKNPYRCGFCQQVGSDCHCD